MENFFQRTSKIFGLEDLERDVLIYRVMPRMIMEIIRKYFRLEVEGGEHLPKFGPAIVTPNHSGYAGFDAVVLGNEIRKITSRIPRILTHHLWFITDATAIPLQKMGMIEATTQNGLNLLKKKNMIVLFPEGEYGNFKPTRRRYRLQEFKRGFIRMALTSGAPIVPTVVIGAEETHITISQLKFAKYLIGTVLPLPLNVLPLPAKWRIKFLPPIYLDHPPSAANNKDLVHKISREVRTKIQKAINQELRNRKTVYIK